MRSLPLIILSPSTEPLNQCFVRGLGAVFWRLSFANFQGPIRHPLTRDNSALRFDDLQSLQQLCVALSRAFAACADGLLDLCFLLVKQPPASQLFLPKEEHVYQLPLLRNGDDADLAHEALVDLGGIWPTGRSFNDVRLGKRFEDAVSVMVCFWTILSAPCRRMDRFHPFDGKGDAPAHHTYHRSSPREVILR